jgi:hypothetical protein
MLEIVQNEIRVIENPGEYRRRRLAASVQCGVQPSLAATRKEFRHELGLCARLAS